MRIRNQKNFAAGLLYIAIGIPVALMASGYRMGTAARMGPGYFPFWLGVLLALVGAIVLMSSMRSQAEVENIGGWDLKSLAVILGSVLVFGVLLTTMGIVVAVAGLVIVSSLASHEFGWTATLVNTAVLILLTFVIFIWGLALQFPIWPPFLES